MSVFRLFCFVMNEENTLGKANSRDPLISTVNDDIIPTVE